MRFSLRTILLVFLIVGLALATFISTWKLQRAEEEIKRVQSRYGVAPNSYEMTYFGTDPFQVDAIAGIHLIRLYNPADYLLKIIIYDGVKQTTQRETVELTQVDLQIGIWHASDDAKGQIQIHTDRAHGRAFEFNASMPSVGEDVIYRYPTGMDTTITQSPFLIYIFAPAGLSDEPNFQWIGLDEEKLKAWCDKYRAKCIYFKFERVAN